jgi:hypothetical protein
MRKGGTVVSLRRLLFVVCVLVFGTLSTAASAVGQSSVVARVTGATSLTVPLSVFDPTLEGDATMKILSYDARVRQDGTVVGRYVYHLEEPGVSFKARGPVTCLAVSGNRAWVGGVIESSNDPTVVGLDSWWQVADGGRGPSAPRDKTTFVGIGEPGLAQAYCDDAPEPRFFFDVQRGFVEVRGETG